MYDEFGNLIDPSTGEILDPSLDPSTTSTGTATTGNVIDPATGNIVDPNGNILGNIQAGDTLNPDGSVNTTYQYSDSNTPTPTSAPTSNNNGNFWNNLANSLTKSIGNSNINTNQITSLLGKSTTPKNNVVITKNNNSILNSPILWVGIIAVIALVIYVKFIRK